MESQNQPQEVVTTEEVATPAEVAKSIFDQLTKANIAPADQIQVSRELGALIRTSLDEQIVSLQKLRSSI